MKNIEIVKFKPWHLITMQKRRCVEQTHLQDEFAYQLAKHPSWSGIYKKEPIGCGGLILLGSGRAEGWSCYPGFAYKFRRSIFVHTKRLLDAAMEEHKLHRVQAHYRMDMPGAKEALCNFVAKKFKKCNWMEHLGFRCEGIARMHEEDKTDALLYSIVKE